MFRRNLNTGSSNAARVFCRQRGFTLVEVMLSTVLVAIGTTLAVPSYRDMVEKRQLTHSAEQLAAFVNSVQVIAARTNQVVTVAYVRAHHDEWCIGASISENECDCMDDTSETFCEIDSQPFVLDESLSNGSQLMHAIKGGSYSFDPVRGLANASLTMELHTDSRKFKLNLMVNDTGRVILCSKDADHAIPGYDLCPVVEVLL